VDIRNLLFKYRSYTPIPLGLIIVYFSHPGNAYLILGIPLLLMGEAIRIWAVSYAGGQTRTRRVGAPALCSSGPFAFVRNPLYLGNMLMYSGIVLIAGSANLWLMVATTFLFFLIQYSLIISLEEETLARLFGEEYEEYKNNVPGFFPRISRWETREGREPSNLLKTLKTEKRTLQNVVLILVLIYLRIQVFS